MSETAYPCPGCSRKLSTPSGLKQHWTKIHGTDYPEGVLEQIPETESSTVEKTFDCTYCGDSFTREVKPGTTRSYCSRSCQGKDTAGGNVDPRKAKPKARQRALDRDNHTCQRCSSQTENAEVHHLIPKMAGGTDHVDNLVTLCKRCHKKAHWEMRDIPEEHPDLLDELREVVCDDE